MSRRRNCYLYTHADRIAADANRSWECERAAQIPKRTCECANEKMTMPDGSRADSCRQCHEIEEQEQQRKGADDRRRDDEIDDSNP